MSHKSIKTYLNEGAGIAVPGPMAMPQMAMYGAAKGVQKVAQKGKEKSDEYGGHRYVKFYVKDKLKEIEAQHNLNVDRCSSVNNDLDMFYCIITEMDNIIRDLQASENDCQYSEDPSECKQKIYEEIIEYREQKRELMKQVRILQQKEIRYNNSKQYDDTYYGLPMERPYR